MLLGDSTFSIPKWKRKPWKSAGTASHSISALPEATSVRVSVKANAGGRWELQEVRVCTSGFYTRGSLVKASPKTLLQQRLTNQGPLLVTGYSNFLHRYCDLPFRKLRSLVMNLYDLQYLLLAGAHRWSASTPD